MIVFNILKRKEIPQQALERERETLEGQKEPGAGRKTGRMIGV